MTARPGTPVMQKILAALCLICVAHPALAAGRGYLGVWFGPLPETERTVQTGVVVKKVFAGMAAEQAGLRPGEIVTQINGMSVPDPKTGVALLAENKAGEKVRLTVIDKSGGELHRSDVFATMGAEPTDDFAKIMTAKPLPPARRCAGRMRDASCRGDAAAAH